MLDQSWRRLRLYMLLWPAALAMACSGMAKPEPQLDETSAAESGTDTDTRPGGSESASTGNPKVSGESSDELSDASGQGNDEAVSMSADAGDADGNVEDGKEDDGDSRFDLGVVPDIDLPQERCDKIDFLFVIDNSHSMAQEQEILRRSIPELLEATESKIGAFDHHVMVVDTDSTNVATIDCGAGAICTDGVCTCGTEDCCSCACAIVGSLSCNGTLCPGAEDPVECDGALGGGRDLNSITRVSCGFPDGRRYLHSDDENFDRLFACAATLGTNGAGTERPMNAMELALGPELNGPGGCNEGFLRDDALLVVTVLTDEDEGGIDGSTGSPAAWMQSLLQLKHHNEDALVALGLIGDRDLPDPVCAEFDASFNGAEPCPVLRQFFNLLSHGLTGSVCESDYDQFFADAAELIGRTCGQH